MSHTRFRHDILRRLHLFVVISVLSIQKSVVSNAYSLLPTIPSNNEGKHNIIGSVGVTRLSVSYKNDNGVDMSEESDRMHWPSTLPLPENTPDDPDLAERAKQAMKGSNPPALEGRCAVNLDYDTKTHRENHSRSDKQNSVQWLHVDPPVFIVDDFLTQAECDNILQLTTHQLPPDAGRVIQLTSKVVSSRTYKPQTRQSTTWYVRYGCKALAPLFHGLSQLLPEVQLNQMEEVQLVQYAGPGQGFAWHEDALDDQTATPEAGGQRIATVLVYLDDVVTDDVDNSDNIEGISLDSLPFSGRTMFRDLVGTNGKQLAVAPKRGRALLFFPAIQGHTSMSDAATAADMNALSSNNYQSQNKRRNQRTDDEPHEKKTFGSFNSFDGTRPDHRTMHAGEPPMPTSGSRADSKGRKHIAQLWIHSNEHTPVVFGRGLNKHEDAQKHIDRLQNI